MYSEELKKFANAVYTNNLWRAIYRKTYNKRYLYLECIESTNFLNDRCGIKESIHCIINDICEDLVCPTCGKPNKLKKNGYEVGFCDVSCSGKYINTLTGLSKAQENGLKSANTIRNGIDKETGLPLIESIKRKISKTKNEIDPLTGLTNAKISGLVQQKTLSEIDKDNGLTRHQKIIKKSRITKSIIDKESGLSINDIIASKSHATRSKVNHETGLTSYQEGSLKIKVVMSKVNSETGLTGYQETGLKAKETLSQIDSITGLTGYQSIGIKAKETLSQIDSITGLSGYQSIGLKTKETLSQIDSKTGLTGYQKNGIQIKETKSIVNDKTGLSVYDEIGLKIKGTLAIVNNVTGLTRSQELQLKSKETLAVINITTGLTRSQEISQKAALTIKMKTFGQIKESIDNNEYMLLTSLNDYIDNGGIISLLEYKCDKCDSITKTYWPYIRCNICYPYNKSIGESEVFEYCQSLYENTESNTRKVIKPLELDVYLPDYDLAIEYNGLYWHSSDNVENENKDYHLNKTLLCKEKGIQLLHIFENEWINPIKQDIWKSIIRNKLGQSERIYGRKCVIKEVSNRDKIEFLEMNHLQGDCSSSVNIGLYYKDELVSLMTFGKSRYDKKIDWELLRFCNRLGSSVLGAASKLLKNFTSRHIGSIVSYADRRRSDGGLYEKLGFELSHESRPNYFYYRDNGILESRIGYQKHKLKDKLKEYNDVLSESDNMYMNGYRKIYDCGNLVYKL